MSQSPGGSGHLELPKPSPLRSSFASAQSDFINTYTRDSVINPSADALEGNAGASSGDAWAFSSSRRNSSPISPVDPALKGAIGLGPLPSAGASGLVRRGSSRTRSEEARRALQDQATGREPSGTIPLDVDARPPAGWVGVGNEPSPLHQDALGDVDPLRFGHDRPSPSSSSHSLELSHVRTTSGSTLYDGPDDYESTAHARLSAHAQLPAGVEPSTYLEEGRRSHLAVNAGRTRRSRRYSDADTHPVSPLSKRGTISAATRALRRASLRVVGLEHSVFDEGPFDPVPAMPSARALPHERLDDPEPHDDNDIPQSPPLAGPSGLKGNSLGLFSPTSGLRTALFRMFRHPITEPLILCLIVADMVVLTIQSAPNVYTHPRPLQGYFHLWTDYALFALFCLFTLEMWARIIVAGLVFNTTAEERKARKDAPRFFADKARSRFPIHRPVTPYADSNEKLDLSPSAMASSTALRPAIVLNSGEPASSSSALDLSDNATLPPDRRQAVGSTLPLSPSYAQKKFFSDAPFQAAVARQLHMTQIAYLRHSWNRVDCLAIIAFWVSFALAMTGLEAAHNLYIFRALSVLRAARLLTITAGTTTILRSLKRAKPLMVDLIFFIVFAGVLLSIIGVQSFKGSFQRTCIWIDPQGQTNYTLSDQFCGGHIDGATGLAVGFIGSDGVPAPGGAKGFVCPQGQLCIAGEAPFNGTQSFNNVGWAALQVAIIASANTWSGVMYNMMDAEYFLSCVFFIVGLLVLNFWLFNIMVAVITNTFADIVEETKQSAFAAAPAQPSGGSHAERRKHQSQRVWLARFYKVADLFWVGVILADFVMQATQNAGNGPQYRHVLVNIELGFTAALALEMLIRFVGYLPDYRSFFSNGKNLVDLGLAIITLIIQIPPIRNSAVYPWLTFFQIARFYRVILAVPRMKSLLRRLRGSLRGFCNMLLFLLGINFVAALIAAQYLRGVIADGSDDVEMTFYQLWNSILAMYQIFSSENWTDVLYAATAAESQYTQAWISAIFLGAWFIFANFVLLQMFIAVISEGFAIPEHLKHKEQLSAFVAKIEPKARPARWRRMLNPYEHLRTTDASAVAVALEYAQLPSEMILPMRKSFVREFVAARSGQRNQQSGPSRFVTRARRALRLDTPFEARGSAEQGDADDRDPLSAIPSRPLGGNEPIDAELSEQARLIQLHPTYDRPFWILSQTNPLRRFCQTVVEPSHGNRLYGQKTNPKYRRCYQSVVFCAILASVIVAAIATPPYRQRFFREHAQVTDAWFALAEVAFGTIFVLEFLIKVIADGFLFTPNAYLHSVWNGIDFFVLCTLVVDVTASIIFANSTSRLTRGLKAFRALRLINLSEHIRTTFYAVFIAGFADLLDASLLTILYILPFAVWGMNLFSASLYGCNDDSAADRIGCAGEFVNSPLQWDFLMPRAWTNPYVYSFDSFRTSVLILFEIISLEGWVDVMTSLMSITGRDQQPQPNASQGNALYSVVYNLFGATVVLTLFLAVIIHNFLLRSGSAHLTSEQRLWIHLRRLIQRQRPSRRPRTIPQQGLRKWAYQRATQKSGWWARMMTTLYVVQIAALMTQTEANAGTWAELARDLLFLCLAVIYAVDVGIRLLGLGSHSFVLNTWNLYDLLVIGGTFATTIPVVLGIGGNLAVQFQKLFLVMIAFKVVTKSNALNQLFKTAIASLPSLAQLFALWLILFLVWGLLYVEMFSLTRWGPSNLTRSSNYQSLPKALVMLAIQSTGEGWNSFMHDYTLEAPYCLSSPSFLFEDCGSAGWAFALFISWNVISMYIVLNMFTGLVVENFAYVFQLYGKVKSISRDEVRGFKRVWAEFDRRGNGYLARSDYLAFFSRLTGVFDVSVYPPELRTKALKEACLGPPRVHFAQTGFADPFSEKALFTSQDDRFGLDRFDLQELRRRLSTVDVAEVRLRKAKLNRIYQEALLSDTPGKGMSFTAMMRLLAHYNLIDESALQLEELVERKQRLEQVEDRIEFDRIRGVLKTFVQRRRFLSHLAARRRAAFGAPPILVEDRHHFETVPIGPSSPPRTPSLGSQRDSPSLPPGAAPPAPSMGGGRRGRPVISLDLSDMDPLSPAHPNLA